MLARAVDEAVAAFAREAGVPCPTIEALLALMRGLDRTRRA